MTPTIGRIVLYTLTEDNAKQINRRRTDSKSIRERMQVEPRQWPEGAQAHIGNSASVGDVVPLHVVRVWPDEYGVGVPGINGQAILDGNDTLWVTSAKEGAQPGVSEPGTWAWPPRV